ncbi:HNH endonuclease [Chloroflexota bacterium]
MNCEAAEMEDCQICGDIRNLDRHHMVPRHAGGRKNPIIHSEDNLIWLCRSCHRNVHEGRWLLDRSPDGLRVIDKETGEQVMRRLQQPELDAPSFFHILNLAEHSLSSLFDRLQYLSDDQLVEAFSYTRSLGKHSWMMQAAILYEAQQRSVYDDHVLEGIARRFEISLRHAQKYALIWRTFFVPITEKGENVNVDAFMLNEPSWYVIAATESPDPHRWLAYAQDRKVQDLRYSVAAFRREIRFARILEGLADLPEGGELFLDEDDSREPWRHCPWVRLYCVCSGRPIPVGQECDTCEFGQDSENAISLNEPIVPKEVLDVGRL